MTFQLTGSTFKEGELVPKTHTCEGEDRSPPLRWSNPPPGTRSFALIADDPDAPGGTWVHWVLYNIPIDIRGLAEALPAQDILPNDAQQGLNDFKRVGYGGPCPPPGKSHRYYFRLYALDQELSLKPRATKAQLLDAMKGHVLAEAQLMGRFGR
ncbi:MAG TPA: YbhB/YbcL family Raf kinase inhibitor-like protein [Nitrospira sp.]|nr:YbhB/YbcL family Raf kinase inhibitor-like protein [Candidatus Nomurabacteria bacterium]HNP80368.1 YbhB/YbcL family Raf kinase inhibitor-like protein [Nitrospira sp.]